MLTSQSKMNRWQRGIELTKNSWQVLKTDKQLAGLPVISFLVTLVALIPFAAVGLLIYNDNSQVQSWEVIVFIACVTLVGTVIANFFSAAIIYGAVQRFGGNKATIGSSMSGALKKFSPLILFSLMMTVVGLILQLIEERVPIAGRIAVMLFNGAWNLANVFAVPVIVLSDEMVWPLQATKRSIGIIKKVWGEGIVVSLGIGLIGFVAFVGYAAIITAISAAVGYGTYGITGTALPAGWLALPIAVLVIGLSILGVIFTTLGSIAKAALYQYAVTGKAPNMFDSEVLAAAASKKKQTHLA